MKTEMALAGLLPRLDTGGVIEHLSALHGTAAADLERMPPTTLGTGTYSSAGFSRVDLDDLLAWRDDLGRWAKDVFAFPGPLGSERRQNEWNVALGRRLADDTSDLPESHHPEVWAWVATMLLPHFVVYRWGWPGLDSEGHVPTTRRPWARFGTGLRNGLRLVIYRVSVLGEDITRRAIEQEFLDVLERPAFGNDPRVARLILGRLCDMAEAGDESYSQHPGGRTDHCKAALKELHARNVLRPFCFRTDGDVIAEVDAAVRRTATTH